MFAAGNGTTHFAFRTEGREGGSRLCGLPIVCEFPPSHPSSFGRFLPLSGRYAAISNELRVRKIYKTSEQLASQPQPAAQLPATTVCGAWHGNQPRSLARSLARSCEIVLRASYFSFPPSLSHFPLFKVPLSGELGLVGRSFRTRRQQVGKRGGMEVAVVKPDLD